MKELTRSLLSIILKTVLLRRYVVDQIIVMNPFARHLRTDRTLRSRLIALMHRKSAIIEAQTVSGLIDTLEQLAKSHASLSNVTVYVVGGDGTFNQVLNWTLSQPTEKRPHLMPIGGGQFNFMCKFVGLKSTDPSKNLAEIFSGRIHLEAQPWRPVCAMDSLSGKKRYGAVVGNGALCDFLEWYEEGGKGDVVDVLKLTVSVIADFGKNIVQGKHGRLKPISGSVTMDDARLPCTEYISLMAASVPEFMPSCRPFWEQADAKTFTVYAYWGHMAALAASVPMIWKGWKSPFTDSRTFNGKAEVIRIETQDPRMLIDGDLHIWPTPKGKSPKRTITIVYGPEVQLLRAV
jgi:hypothetical protein